MWDCSINISMITSSFFLEKAAGTHQRGIAWSSPYDHMIMAAGGEDWKKVLVMKKNIPVLSTPRKVSTPDDNQAEPAGKDCYLLHFSKIVI